MFYMKISTNKIRLDTFQRFPAQKNYKFKKLLLCNLSLDIRLLQAILLLLVYDN